MDFGGFYVPAGSLTVSTPCISTQLASLALPELVASRPLSLNCAHSFAGKRLKRGARLFGGIDYRLYAPTSTGDPVVGGYRNRKTEFRI